MKEECDRRREYVKFINKQHQAYAVWKEQIKDEERKYFELVNVLSKETLERYNAAMAKYEQYLNPRYNDLIFPNIKVEKVDYKTINETKSAVATVYSQALASWFNKGSVSDGDWNAFVNSMKNAGVENLVAVMQKYVDAKKA
jgi:hypothetical protein